MHGLVALIATVVLFQFGAARGAPGDIFSIPAPVIGSDPPKASDIADGDASVSTQTGALRYSYPIRVPPGRNGMVPQLALSYSSQAPIYGGLAAGWSLSIPEIREDTSQGRLRTHSPEVEGGQADPLADDRFVSTMAGGRPLIPVTEPTSSGVYKTYRAQNDTSFMRYERMNAEQSFRWRVYSTDGTTYFFGDRNMHDCVRSDGFAPLTSAVDAFGNEVAYEYESRVGAECRIRRIFWGQNAAAGLTSPFAQVVFRWNKAPQCGNIETGSQRDYRTGTLIVTEASKLVSIAVTAFPPGSPTAPEHTRIVTLNYSAADESCTTTHAPLRLLTSIQESAFGTDSPRVDLPAVTFEYGDATITLVTPQLLHGTPWFDLPRGFVLRHHNVGWGHRRTDGRWPTVEAMMLDLDGDGLLDRVSNASTETAPGDGQCKANWQRNLGPAAGTGHPQFGPHQTFTLPRLKWNGTTTGASPIAGAATADPAFLHLEGCALNGQFTAFRNSVGVGAPPQPYSTYLVYRWLDMDADGLVDLVAAVHGHTDVYDIVQGDGFFEGQPRPPEPDLFGPWPACPAQMDRCKAVSASCTAAARTCPAGGPCMIKGSALNACLASAATLGCRELINKDLQSPQLQPPGHDPHAPISQAPYTRCEGLYPWFIYKNTGNGTFASSPVIKYQPVQLESDFGDSSIMSSVIVAQYHGVLDFDGDGILDVIVRPSDPNGSQWFVWLGDGTGGFGPRRYTFPTRPAPRNLISGISAFGEPVAQSSEGLFDINGDGLPEHWLTSNNLNANLTFHDGTRHRPFGELETPVKPGNDAKATVTAHTGQLIRAGDSTATNRTLDVDHDGRIDIVQYLPGATRPTVFFNVGGQFNAPGVEYPGGNIPGFGDFTGFLRQTKAIDGLPPELSWELSGDLMDLDGDGIAEAAYFGPNGFVRAVHNPIAPPPRLLYRIHNGRRAHTTIEYASMHDKTAVEQHPEQTWSDGRPKASPHTQWVVKTLTVVDDFAKTTSTTSQFYKNPRHGADDEGYYSFRGFEEVTTTAPSGAKTVQRYAYTPDWSGRLVTTLVHPAEAPDEVRSIDKTTWVERELFDGAIKTYHATITQHFTCANGQTEATCTAASAPGYTRTISNLSPLGSDTQTGGPKLLWAETTSLLQSGTSAADGDRQTLTRYVLYADGTTYRLRPFSSRRQHRVNGTMTTFAASSKGWDPTYRVPRTDNVWLDTNGANRAITRSEYDMATGNVTRRWKPMQNVANTTYTSFTYDPRKLFVATEINEVGHQFDYTYEYGTGTKLQTSGPNVRSCTTTCPPAEAKYPVKEQDKIRIDGLGRPIERWDTFSDDGSIYTLYQLETTSYVDTPTATVPTSSSNRIRIDRSPASVWKQGKTELDGHGRPIKKTVFAQGSAPNDQVTTFRYRNDGTLETVSVPDPTANNAALVSYTYGFDSLGRATSIRRPDAAASADQSGVDIAYNGVTQTTTEVVGAASGQVAVTKAINDKFGRLIEVHERTAVTPLTFAITKYTYSPDDIIASVVDPQNVTTALTHDFAGRRTQIARHGRTWKYRYDKNGNMTAEQVPGSSGPATDPDYTTTIAYDDLDRQVSKEIGKRNLSPADLALFGSGTEKFTWDNGPNQKGYLRYWQAFAPGSSTAAITLEVGNNNQGQRILTNHTLNIAGYTNLLRQIRQNFFLFGGVRTAVYGDVFMASGNLTISEMSYDARLLPRQMRLIRTGEPQYDAVQTRNVAGLVTKRRTDTNTGAMPFVESNWTYDQLGRVTSQVVQKGPGPTQVVRQDLSYFGNDDPKTLTHYLGATPKQFQFGYDLRHQLTSATAGAGYFTANYSYGLGGRFTRATEAQTIAPLPAGTEVKPRDVNYIYSGTDPEQVTALTNVGNGQTYASYTYDAAGNQLTRTYPSTNEAWDYLYDGKDQLRRATRKRNGVVQGSEEYWYDNEGQRIAVVKRNAAGAKTELIWFIGDTQAHYDAAGALTHVYSQLSMGTPVARIDRTSNTSTSVEYQFHGLASNTIAAVDQRGAVNASFSYAPFGEVIEATNAGGAPAGMAVHKRRLNDKYVDDLSDLAYYGVRYYDKTLIAWTQGDPLYRFAPDSAWTEARRARLYAFTGNNPLRYIDPDGRDFWEIVFGSGGAATGRAAGAGAAAAGLTLTTIATVAIPIGGVYILSELTGGPINVPEMISKVLAAERQPKIKTNPSPRRTPTGVTVSPGGPYRDKWQEGDPETLVPASGPSRSEW